MFGNYIVGNRPAANEVFLDNTFKNLWGTGMVPGSFWIDDSDGAALTDTQTVRLGPVNAAGAGQFKFLQPSLQEFPGEQAGFFIRAFGLGLVTAQKNVALDLVNAQSGGDFLQGFGHFYLQVGDKICERKIL
jgi:hypothetical protein